MLKIVIILSLFSITVSAKSVKIPVDLYSEIAVPAIFGNLNKAIQNGEYRHFSLKYSHSLINLREGFSTKKNGIELDLKNEEFEGELVYGFFPYEKLSTPIFFKRSQKKINDLKKKLQSLSLKEKKLEKEEQKLMHEVGPKKEIRVTLSIDS